MGTVTFDISNRIFSVLTTDPADAGDYSITINVYTDAGYNCGQIPLYTFDLHIVDPCISAQVSISATPVLSSLTYTIGGGVVSNDRTISATSDVPTCPTINYGMIYVSGAALDATIFTWTYPQLDISSTDTTVADTYNLRLTVKHTGYPVTDFVDFEVTLIDPCLSAILSMKMSYTPVDNIEYRIGDPQATYAYVPSDIVESTNVSGVCQAIIIDIVLTNGQPLDPEVFTLSADELDIESADVYKKGIQDVKLIAKYSGVAYTFFDIFDF